MTREVMTSAQAAEYLQVDLATIYRWIREGRLNASRIGRGYRIQRRSMDLLFIDQRVRSDVPIREYTEEQIAEFLELDRLTPEAAAIIRAFEQQVR